MPTCPMPCSPLTARPVNGIASDPIAMLLAARSYSLHESGKGTNLEILRSRGEAHCLAIFRVSTLFGHASHPGHPSATLGAGSEARHGHLHRRLKNRCPSPNQRGHGNEATSSLPTYLKPFTADENRSANDKRSAQRFTQQKHTITHTHVHAGLANKSVCASQQAVKRMQGHARLAFDLCENQ